MVRLVCTVLATLMAAGALAQAPLEQPSRVPPLGRFYVVAVCAASEEVSDDCLSQGRDVAARAFADIYLKAYRGYPFLNSLRLRFPYGWAEGSQTRFLREIEAQGIRLARAQIARDIAAVTPAGLRDSEGGKADGWETLALAEASDGRNWSHDWRENKHDLESVHVQRQLRQADLRSGSAN